MNTGALAPEAVFLQPDPPPCLSIHPEKVTIQAWQLL
jgi:hypothetical protein